MIQIPTRWFWLLLIIATINVTSFAVVRWAYLQGSGLDLLGKVKCGDIVSITRAMIVSFCLGVPFLTGHALVHYLSIEEQSANAEESELVEVILGEGEIGGRVKGFKSLANLLKLLAYVCVGFGFVLAVRILMVLFYR